MRPLLARLALAGALWAAGAGMAAAEDIPVEGMTGMEVAVWLDKAGFAAELVEDASGDPLIKTALDGQAFSVYFYDCGEGERCKALQFQADFDLDAPLTAEKINVWNREHRYLKAYIDDDGDPHVAYDVNVNDGRTYAGLNDDFGVWTNMLPDFTSFIGEP